MVETLDRLPYSIDNRFNFETMTGLEIMDLIAELHKPGPFVYLDSDGRLVCNHDNTSPRGIVYPAGDVEQ